MVFYMNLLFIVIAVSLDGFGVGVTYGMRKMRIPFAALFVIMLCSGVIVLIAMMVGQMLRAIISPAVASSIGSAILILIGVFVLCSIIRTNRRGRQYESVGSAGKKTDEAGEPGDESLLGEEAKASDMELYGRKKLSSNRDFSKDNIFSSDKANASETFSNRETVNQLQHFKSVLSDPFQADKDKSGTISVSEAFILGTALALDAFGAGLGAAMLGYSPMITAVLVASMSGIFVFSGIKVGFLLSQNRTIAKFTFMPPVLLICIGVFNLI